MCASLIGLLLLSLLWGARTSTAQTYCQHGGQGWKPVGYQTVTVTTAAVQSIDMSALPQASTNLAMAMVSTEQATIRFQFLSDLNQRMSPTDGHELAPGNNFFLCGREILASFRMIRTSMGSADAIVHISLFAPM